MVCVCSTPSCLSLRRNCGSVFPAAQMTLPRLLWFRNTLSRYFARVPSKYCTLLKSNIYRMTPLSSRRLKNNSTLSSVRSRRLARSRRRITCKATFNVSYQKLISAWRPLINNFLQSSSRYKRRKKRNCSLPRCPPSSPCPRGARAPKWCAMPQISPLDVVAPL